jgi:hypothetical protein
MDVCLLWVLCVLSGRGLCDGLITRPEESYRLWCVLVCDLGTSKMRRLKPASGLWKPVKLQCLINMAVTQQQKCQYRVDNDDDDDDYKLVICTKR